ncbi:Uncharacterised protein [BD1-7 clade bacterium]|uniref:Uncharacterized protein n=1 Tax=BD1-7 clade bacterium TaxID=2029982 RepID=A0A5S9P3H0_9GAMM|nr:Uncharacterised protein [BD1-7 clade bacterium]CAA0122924.1 Uncharacterised protein [BD1-7 clade bacterium]
MNELQPYNSRLQQFLNSREKREWALKYLIRKNHANPPITSGGQPDLSHVYLPDQEMRKLENAWAKYKSRKNKSREGKKPIQAYLTKAAKDRLKRLLPGMTHEAKIEYLVNYAYGLKTEYEMKLKAEKDRRSAEQKQRHHNIDKQIEKYQHENEELKKRLEAKGHETLLWKQQAENWLLELNDYQLHLEHGNLPFPHEKPSKYIDEHSATLTQKSMATADERIMIKLRSII